MDSKVTLAPNLGNQKLSVFKLHKDDDITWSDAKIKRESDFQPWQIKLGSGRAARRFKAVKEGGVGENASYFIVYKNKSSADGTFEVCPVDEWYNVSATQRYKTLTAEEAEQKFEQRHRTLNYFNVMHNKKGDDVEDEKPSTGHEFKISEMDDWRDSGDDFSGSDKEGEDQTVGRRRAKKKSTKNGDDADVPLEGKEDSDEGDFEQREVDYMSDSSESDESDVDKKDVTDVKGIAEEEALRELLWTDDEEDTDGSPNKNAKSPLDKSAIITSDINQDPNGEAYEESSDSDDYDVDEDKMDSMIREKDLPAQFLKHAVKDELSARPNVMASSSSTIKKETVSTQQATSSNKRKPEPMQASTSSSSQPTISPPKRHCPLEHTSPGPQNTQDKIVEDLIKKYLSRKPLPVRELLKNIRKKMKRMNGHTLDSDLLNRIALILKRLNIEKEKINGTTYLHIKT